MRSKAQMPRAVIDEAFAPKPTAATRTHPGAHHARAAWRRAASAANQCHHGQAYRGIKIFSPWVSAPEHEYASCQWQRCVVGTRTAHAGTRLRRLRHPRPFKESTAAETAEDDGQADRKLPHDCPHTSERIASSAKTVVASRTAYPPVP
jgi:hypothetical protein